MPHLGLRFKNVPLNMKYWKSRTISAIAVAVGVIGGVIGKL
jgi:hypothetical protein